MQFQAHIGIDYSGASFNLKRNAKLQVYSSSGGEHARRVGPPDQPANGNWNRKEIAYWLIKQAESGVRYIAGIDHAFSFPQAYFDKYMLGSWDQFLDDFCRHWPLHKDGTRARTYMQAGSQRTGKPTWFRLTERKAPPAKSVFLFDVEGAVAMSSHCGIPYLSLIRAELGEDIHIWPFDGWQLPEDKPVIIEVYPRLWKSDYPKDPKHTLDQHDAFVVASKLRDLDASGSLPQLCEPDLEAHDRSLAELEGWILGTPLPKHRNA